MPWTEGWDDRKAEVERQAPAGRSGRPDDIAEAVLGCIRSRYMTGNITGLDGGITLWT